MQFEVIEVRVVNLPYDEYISPVCDCRLTAMKGKEKKMEFEIFEVRYDLKQGSQGQGAHQCDTTCSDGGDCSGGDSDCGTCRDCSTD